MKWFWQKKSEVEILQKAHGKKLQEAMLAQRSGNIQKTAELHAEAEEILAQIREQQEKAEA